MEKNKRNKIIGLSIGILIVLIIVVSSTYAYWQITKTQETPNDIVAACLDLNLEDKSAAIDLDSAWPISDEEGKKLTGYTFTVTNNCNEEINYIVGLNRVEEENHLQDSSIKLQLDDNSAFLYSDLSDVEYVDPDNTEYTARSSKQVSVETISANGTNTHTIRVWVSDEAPVTEQSKKFLGQVFITGGQGIEVPECFTIAENGTITGYNYECGTEVVVPAEINGIQVKTISAASFAEGNLEIYILEDNKMVVYSPNPDYEDGITNFAKQMMCGGEDCNLEDVGITILIGEEEYNNFDWNSHTINEYMKQYYNPDTGTVGLATNRIKSLNLSETVYLETIGDSSFYDSKLNNVIFPVDGNLTIESSAFRHIPTLTEVTITKSVKHIGETAFYSGGDYDTIINDTCHWDTKDEVYICKGNLEKLTILPDSTLISIGVSAFKTTN